MTIQTKRVVTLFFSGGRVRITGEWKGEGVKGPEAFNADPFLALLNEHGAPWAIEERPMDGRPA